MSVSLIDGHIDDDEMISEKDAKTLSFIIKRQNEEIRELKEKCEALNRIVDNKKYEIGRLKYQVNKYKKMAGGDSG